LRGLGLRLRPGDDVVRLLPGFTYQAIRLVLGRLQAFVADPVDQLLHTRGRLRGFCHVCTLKRLV
jgi:hypothetical protein